jgi:uncharacterized iron-regulated membrane protein
MAHEPVVGDQAWDDWSFPLHTGDWGRTITRVVWTGLAITPLVPGGTGLTMWLIRRSERRKRVRTKPAEDTPVVVTPQG